VAPSALGRGRAPGGGHELVGWIVVQVALLGWPPHWLQMLYFLWGLVILALAMLLLRAPLGARAAR
jgi:hypothetical protein